MAYDSNIEKFKQAVSDGARLNRFIITFLDPSTKEVIGADLSYFVKSASIPTRDVGVAEITYQGMKVKLAGDPTFGDWSCTLILDKEYKARKAFELWQTLCFETLTNTRGSQLTYKSPIRISQLSGKNEVVATYDLIGAWPSSVGEVSFAQDSNDAVGEFTVNFNYDYWVTV